MTIFTTAIYAGLLGLLLLALSYNVSRVRRRRQIGLGHGEHDDLLRAIRAQGNFVEYVPMALILLLSVEMLAYRGWVTHLMGISLVVARLFHAWGISQHSGKSTGRIVGIALTWGTILVGSLLVLGGALVGFSTSYE